MTTTTRKFFYLVASVLALSFASAGCALSAEVGAEGLDLADVAATEQALTEEGDCPEGIESTVTEIGPNEYTIVTRTTLDASAGAVWARVQNFEQLLTIGFAGQSIDFQWLDSAPGQIPSLVQFTFGGQTIVEEIFYRNSEEKVLRYRILETPVLGFEEYTAEIAVIPCATGTIIQVSREITLSPGVSVDPFVTLFEQELATLDAYFNGDMTQ